MRWQQAERVADEAAAVCSSVLFLKYGKQSKAGSGYNDVRFCNGTAIMMSHWGVQIPTHAVHAFFAKV